MKMSYGMVVIPFAQGLCEDSVKEISMLFPEDKELNVKAHKEAPER